MKTLHEKRSGDRKNMKINTNEYIEFFDFSKEKSLTHRRFKHVDIEQLIDQKRTNATLDVLQIGESFEGKSIYELKYGKGDKKVMMWSQMHGNEATATMALFDLFNFLESGEGKAATIRSFLQEKLTIHFIPMLNPDGSDKFERRNAELIDINRDARATKTQEGKLLKKRALKIRPDFAFNLHDQNIYYNVPGTQNPVNISLLAPAYNENRNINSVRKSAMQLIGSIHKLLQKFIPHAVAKYDDTHSPRGFGDNFQRWGASTILVESGAMKGDREKQEIRKLNFILLLHALIEIAKESYTQYSIQDYERIPFNASQLHDLVLRNVTVEKENGKSFTTDLAIRQEELTVDRDYYVRGEIFDIGDLRDEYGYTDKDMQGLTFCRGKIHTEKAIRMAELTNELVYDFLREGYLALQVCDGSLNGKHLHSYPIEIFTSNRKPELLTQPILEGSASFFLKDKERLRFAIVNGYLIDLEKRIAPKVKNNIF